MPSRRNFGIRRPVQPCRGPSDPACGWGDLVSERAAGTRRIYRLNPAAVAALRDQLDTY